MSKFSHKIIVYKKSYFDHNDSTVQSKKVLRPEKMSQLKTPFSCSKKKKKNVSMSRTTKKATRRRIPPSGFDSDIKLQNFPKSQMNGSIIDWPRDFSHVWNKRGRRKYAGSGSRSATLYGQVLFEVWMNSRNAHWPYEQAGNNWWDMMIIVDSFNGFCNFWPCLMRKYPNGQMLS